MADTLRCAVIGVGAIGLHHLEGFKKHPKAELAAICDIHEGRRNAAADKHGVKKRVEDYKDILKDPSIDAVSIALPNYLHRQVTIEALKAGKHVMLDKPMATKASDSQAMIDAWKEKKVVFMVGQNQRFNKDSQMVWDYIKKGKLGEVYHARAFWLRRAGIPRIGSWFTQKKFSGGGCCYDIGVHFLDLALHCMGTFEAESVSGIVSTRFGHRGMGDGTWGKGEIDPAKPFDVEDFASAFIKLKGGKSVVLEVSWALQHDNGRDHGIDFYGTEGGASLYPAKIYRVQDQNYETITPDYQTLPIADDRMVHFVDCVLNKIEPFVKLEESLKVQKILDGIYESSATGKEVRIS